MRDTDKVISRIDKDNREVFSQREVEDEKFIPWAFNSRTISKILKSGALKHIKKEGITPVGNTILIFKQDLLRYLKKHSSKI